MTPVDKFSEAYGALTRVAAEAHRRKWEHSNNADDPADNTQAYRDLHHIGELARVARDALTPEIRRRREAENSPLGQLMRKQRAKLLASLQGQEQEESPVGELVRLRNEWPPPCAGHEDCERCDITDPCPCCGLYYDSGQYVLPEPKHTGGNAEDCGACRAMPPGKIPYPWICPGQEK